ncbi:MAG: SLC13/DASS family transporter [Bacteroidaceae bacterium]|nr:SLC13/DASS family transporter [Bacteroidaceae bacterium]
MFKSFQGFTQLEKIQKDKQHKRKRNVSWTTLKLLFIILITCVVAVMPTEYFGIEGLTTTQHRVIVMFIFAALMWLTEALPSWVTSMVVVVVMLLTVSNSAFNFLIGNDEQFGQLVKYADIMHCFANPTIMLFIGGFVLAIGMTKTKLDVALARVLLKPFGTKSEIVLLGFILVTAIFSAFVSNTATAAMMLAFLAPVLRSLPADGKGRIALALAIPVGANLGGMMTPIGTPPNLIVLDNLEKFNGISITFTEWMMRMIPFVLVLLFISWLLLRFLFPFKQKNIEIKIDGEMRWDFHTIVVVATFVVTIFLWMFGKELWGLNTNVVAMIPIAAFCASGILQRRDLEEINWSVLWMVAGGFALGVALDNTGLGKTLINAIPFATWSPLVVMIISGLVCFVFSNFISHSAATSLLAPILGLVASGILSPETSTPEAISSFEAMGGASALMVGVAISASVSMILPISTPPNAIAHSTGFIEQKDMMKVGISIGLIGLVLGYAMLIFFKF